MSKDILAQISKFQKDLSEDDMKALIEDDEEAQDFQKSLMEDWSDWGSSEFPEDD
jgi:hypothetical protein